MPSAEEYKEQQKSTWNKFSGGWKKWDDLVMEMLSGTGKVMIEKVSLESGDKVMDMSTGTGEPGLTAAGLVGDGEVIGVDLAEDMLAVALEKAQAKGVANYSTRVFDGFKVPFDDSIFDASLCRFGVIFSPQPAALLADMVRVTKKGGKLAVSSWAPKEENPWATTAALGVAKHVEVPQPPADAPGIFRYADAEELKRDMQSAGLKNVEITPVSGIFELDSAELYWAYMSEIAAPIVIALSNADDETRTKVGESVKELARQFEKDGKIAFPWKSWVVRGEKQ